MEAPLHRHTRPHIRGGLSGSAACAQGPATTNDGMLCPPLCAAMHALRGVCRPQRNYIRLFWIMRCGSLSHSSSPTNQTCRTRSAPMTSRPRCHADRPSTCACSAASLPLVGFMLWPTDDCVCMLCLDSCYGLRIIASACSTCPPASRVTIDSLALQLRLTQSSVLIQCSSFALQLRLAQLGDRTFHVQPTCATNGEGLWEGVKWLAEHVKPI
jgi:hypothetical protein